MRATPFRIITGDTIDTARTLDDNSIDLLITSPPYNIGKAYEKTVDLAQYLASYNEFATHIFTKIFPKGSVCWAVGNYINDGEVYPLDIYFYEIFKAVPRTLFAEILGLIDQLRPRPAPT